MLIYNTSTHETETRGTRVQGQPGQYSRLYLKKSYTKEGTFSLILASHAKSHSTQRTNSIITLKGKYQS